VRRKILKYRDILLEINVSSVAHTPEVWATEETLISNRISIACLEDMDSSISPVERSCIDLQ
jgi:hypothetical protein